MPPSRLMVLSAYSLSPTRGWPYVTMRVCAAMASLRAGCAQGSLHSLSPACTALHNRSEPRTISTAAQVTHQKASCCAGAHLGLYACVSRQGNSAGVRCAATPHAGIRRPSWTNPSTSRWRSQSKYPGAQPRVVRAPGGREERRQRPTQAVACHVDVRHLRVCRTGAQGQISECS